MNPGDYPLNGSPFHVPPSYAQQQQQHPPQQQQQQQHGAGQGSPGTPVESGSPHAMQHSPFPYTTFAYPNHSYPQYPQYPQPIMMYGHARAPPHNTQAGPSTTPTTPNKPTPTSAKRKSLLPASADPIHVELTTSLSLQVVATSRGPQRQAITRSEQKLSAPATVVGAERSGPLYSPPTPIDLSLTLVSDAISSRTAIPPSVNTASNRCSSAPSSCQSQKPGSRRRRRRMSLRLRRRSLAGGRLHRRLMHKKARHAFLVRFPH